MILASVVLTLVSLVGQALKPVLGEFVKLINVGSELSVPTWYASTLMLLCSVLLATITLSKRQRRDPQTLRWGILSAIFLFLCLDDMLTLHERTSSTLVQPTLRALGYEPGGVLSYAWVILYAPLVLVFVLAYFRFWLNLPARVRFMFLVAGVLFVGGGILTEMFNAWYDSVFGRGTLLTATMTHFEEFLEMIGPSVFVYALLSYLGSTAGEVRLHIGEVARTRLPNRESAGRSRSLDRG